MIPVSAASFVLGFVVSAYSQIDPSSVLLFIYLSISSSLELILTESLLSGEAIQRDDKELGLGSQTCGV